MVCLLSECAGRNRNCKLILVKYPAARCYNNNDSGDLIMTIFFRAGALILLLSMIAACGGGGGGGSTSGSVTSDDRNTGTGQPDNTNNPPDAGEPPAPPVAADLTTNVFFPVFPGMALYYDDQAEPSQMGEALVNGDERVFPLQHPDERVEYITSTTHEVGLKGIYLRAIEGATPVYLDLMFDTPRRILGNALSYSSSGNANVKITGIAGTYKIPVTLNARLAGNESISIGALPAQPARHIRLDMRLSVDIITRALILMNYPWVEPLLDAIPLDLWFVPGIGIARIQQGEWNIQLTAVDGIPQPHVFSVLRLANVNNIVPLQMSVNGDVLTDPQWQQTIYYRTSGENWLDVQYDSTGSWRARLTRTDLAKGVYAATVRFTQGDVTQDATVSLLIR